MNQTIFAREESPARLCDVPLMLGVLRRLEVATLIDRLISPHPAHGLAPGRGVEALGLAILDGHHALYQVGQRLEERGMLALLQPGLPRASLHDYRLGHIRAALFAAPRMNKRLWTFHPIAFTRTVARSSSTS